MRIHHLKAEDALLSLHSRAGGLEAAEAARRLEEFGANAVSAQRGPSVVRRLARQFVHFLALLLWLAAALAGAASVWFGAEGMATLAAAIVGVIVINAVFTLWQEERGERALEALRELLPRTCRVLRDGAVREEPVARLVPGDIILLAGGDIVPADCRLLAANGLRANMAAVTGEAEAVLKDAQPSAEHELVDAANILLAGTVVTAGEGTAVVFATGRHTVFGEIARLTAAQKAPPSPLQREVAHLSRLIAVLATVLGGVFFAAGLAAGMPLLATVLFAIGIIVANVPEGLLPTVTLALAMAAQRLAARKMLVRHLAAVESLGSVTVICTDKTGTLTENRMVPARLLAGATEADLARPLPDTAPELAAIMTHCHSLTRLADGTLAGDPLEAALLDLAGGEIGGRRLVHEVPFDTERRRMATLHADDDGGLVLYAKGALDALLPLCARLDGRPLDAAGRTRLREAEAAMAGDGLRVLAFAHRRVDAAWTADTLERDLDFAGMVGLIDPVRPEVPDAVVRCLRAGIRVLMITGDHPLTARAVARAIGMAGPDTPVLTGDHLQRMSQTQLQLALDHPAVIFARTRVDQKRRIVAALQEKGAFVAVTGDGVNDAPALRQADVGIAMGRGGTDVAREAADMVMVDDNFATIVAAVEEGRAVFDNIRKFLGYILTSNIPQIVPFLAFVLLDVPLALTVIQILVIDLGTDMVPALALAAERPQAGVMDRPPRRRDQRLLDAPLLVRAYLVRGPAQALAGMAAFVFVLHGHGWTGGPEAPPTGYAEATAACLGAIIALQVVNLFLSRSDHASVFAGGLPRNRLLLAGLAAEITVGALVLYTPAGNLLFQTAPVPAEAWLFILPFALPLIAADEIWKMVRRWRRRRRA